MFKPKFSFAGALLLMIASICAAAHAADPVLPPDSIGPDALAVVHIDRAYFTPDLLKQAATAVLGANAEAAGDAIAKIKEKYDLAVKSGVQAVTMVMGDATLLGPDAGPEKPTPIVMYVQLRPEADVKAVANLMISCMDQPDVVYEQKGIFLVVHPKDVPLPATIDAARAAAFADALATMSGASLQLAFIATPRVKQEMEKQELPLKELKVAQMVLANARWTAIAVTLGNMPAVTGTVHAADANSGKQLSDGINLNLDNLRQKLLAEPKPGDPLTPLFVKLMDSLRPTTDGDTVTIRLKGEPLTNAASLVTVNLKAIFGQSERARVMTDIANLEAATEFYRSQCGEYPRNLDALVHNPAAPGWAGPYLKKGLPVDPWGHPYQYAFPGKHNSNGFDLWSSGDGKNPPDGLDNWSVPVGK